MVVWRSGHHAPEDVLSCCQTTLKDLQLDYLDLYLIHGPIALLKSATFPNLADEDKLGYSPEGIAGTWAVSWLALWLLDSCLSLLIGYGGACQQGAG